MMRFSSLIDWAMRHRRVQMDLPDIGLTGFSRHAFLQFGKPWTEHRGALADCCAPIGPLLVRGA